MKRFGVILAVQFVVIGIAAFLGSWAFARWQRPAAPLAGDEISWFQSQLGLTGEQAAKLDKIHDQFLAEQSKLCAEHCSKRVDLGELIKQSDSVTPRIEQLTRELSELETKSQRLTIEHIFAVSKQLNSSQREKFVSKVYEQMCSSCPMGMHKPVPGKQASCGSPVCECCVASDSHDTQPAPPIASLPVPQMKLNVFTSSPPIAIADADRQPCAGLANPSVPPHGTLPLFVVLSVFRI